MKALWDFVTLGDGDEVPSKACLMATVVFWTVMPISLVLGSYEGHTEGHCVIKRPVQIIAPPYLIGCILWGENLPQWKLGVEFEE